MTVRAPGSPRRIPLLDEVRGLCVVLMVIYHGLYTIGYLFGGLWARKLFQFFAPAEPFFAGIFIFLCGLCCVLSRNNWKRGGLLWLVAAGVSVVMALFFPETPIWFGVLHLLATGILLFALTEKGWRHIPTGVGMALCGVLFLLCWRLPVQYGPGVFGIPGVWSVPVPGSLIAIPWLYPLGLGRIPGFQSDYFPVLPWIFCFFAGSFAGRFVKAGKLPAFARRSHVRPLAFLGRHALMVYIVHQPLIFGTVWVVYRLMGR